MIKNNKNSTLTVQYGWRSVTIGATCINRFEGEKPFKIQISESENDNSPENSDHHAKNSKNLISRFFSYCNCKLCRAKTQKYHQL